MDCPECEGSGEIEQVEVDRTTLARRGKLERGWRKTWLIHELAVGGAPDSHFADAMGVTRAAIFQFKKRHAEEIEARRRDMTNELAQLWIADKMNRLAEMQQDVEDINDIVGAKLEQADEKPFDVSDPGADTSARLSAVDDLPVWFRTKAMLLRAVADELGQIPQKVDVRVGAAVVTYAVEGVNMDQI